MCPDFTAQYNLGVLFAQGRGTGQNFLEAAYWFEQAAREGDEEAEKLCRRCTVEFLQQKTAAGSARELFGSFFLLCLAGKGCQNNGK